MSEDPPVWETESLDPNLDATLPISLDPVEVRALALQWVLRRWNGDAYDPTFILQTADRFARFVLNGDVTLDPKETPFNFDVAGRWPRAD